MSISAETDRGRATELANGVLVGRAPLMRLGNSIYLFIVAQDPSRSLPLTKPSDRPGGSPQMSLRLKASIDAEISGQWSTLEYRDGGGSAGAGPEGTEFIAQQVYMLPSDAEPDRIRIQYGFEGLEPVEELLTF